MFGKGNINLVVVEVEVRKEQGQDGKVEPARESDEEV